MSRASWPIASNTRWARKPTSICTAEAAPVRPKVLEALARTKYTTLVDVYDYVDVEEMRRYVERNGDQRTETATQQR